MAGVINLAAAVAEIVNKVVPGRKEAAINELHALEGLLARALKENEAILASQIRKRMKDLRVKFPDIE